MQPPKKHAILSVWFSVSGASDFAETVYEDIAFGPRNKGLTPEETDRAVKDAMAFAGLDCETFAQRSPFRLSGGQMRRVAIAGVVAMEPDY
mgnify:CR=1 FL=1